MPWISFEDVEQIIRVHIYQKWDQWDQKRDLKPWINKIISNQFKNILRNYYLNFAKPCSNCPFDSSIGGENLCSFTKSGSQDSSCPLYKKWEKSKKNAYEIKIPVSLEKVTYKKTSEFSDHISMYSAENKLHTVMRENLSNRHFFIYKMLFIDCVDEEQVAKILGYKTNEKGRKAGYKQIKNLKNMYKNLAKRIITKYDIFL